MEYRIVFGARLGAAIVGTAPQQLLPPRILRRQCWPLAMHRYYATSNTLAGTTKTSSRKQVTIGNDDGSVPWGQLSAGEKAARTTQQTFNFGVILAGAVGLVWRRCVSLCVVLIQVRLLLATISTSMSSPPTVKLDTSIERLTGSEPTLVHLACLGLVKRSAHLVNPQQANGPEIDQLRKQERYVVHHTYHTEHLRLGSSSSIYTDRNGIEHFQMHFNVLQEYLHDQYFCQRLTSGKVVGSERSGVVKLHWVKGPGYPDWDYRIFALDVPGMSSTP